MEENPVVADGVLTMLENSAPIKEFVRDVVQKAVKRRLVPAQQQVSITFITFYFLVAWCL